MKNLTYDDFTEAFLTFIQHHCVPVLCGGGEIGGNEPPYIGQEIRIVMNDRGSGYIHLLGQDSETINFKTLDHFRSQDMITPTQRKQISDLTAARATKIVREENKKLKQQLAEANEKLSKIKQLNGQINI